MRILFFSLAGALGLAACAATATPKTLSPRRKMTGRVQVQMAQKCILPYGYSAKTAC